MAKIFALMSHTMVEPPGCADGFLEQWVVSSQATAVTFRYFGQLWMSPKELKDFRANLTGNMDIKITAPLAFRTTINLNHDSAILVGRPTDIRSTFGFVWTSQ